MGVQKYSRTSCGLCGKLHYKSKCHYVTVVSIKKKILRNEKRCFRCLMKGHICKTSYKCYNCQGKNDHTSICGNTTIMDVEKDSKSQKPTFDNSEENEERVTMLTDGKTDLLLQTADCIVSNPRETKILQINVLLDQGSQKTYLSDAVQDYLKPDAINKQNVSIKTFGSTNGQLNKMGEFKFAFRGLLGNGLRMNLSGFSVQVVSDLDISSQIQKLCVY